MFAHPKTVFSKALAVGLLLLILGVVDLNDSALAFSRKKSPKMPVEGDPIELSPSPFAPPKDDEVPTTSELDKLIPEDSASSSELPGQEMIAPPTARSGQKMSYKPYNTFSRELDLWNLEGRRFIRSPMVLSPDMHFFAYSEVIFSPSNRQTMSRLYRVPVQSLPPIEAQKVEGRTEKPWFVARMDPDKTLQRRESLLQVGYNKNVPFDFKTLTIVDWSASGQRLLVKQKSGVLHEGLRTSDIFVYDQKKGSVTIFPEVRRAIAFYWRTEGNMPNISRLNWELYPLGWEAGSDSRVIFKAWALDSTDRKFLGVWRYDIDQLGLDRLSLEDMAVQVAANGWLAVPPLPAPPPPPPTKKELKKQQPKKISKTRVYQLEKAQKRRLKKDEEMHAKEGHFEIPEGEQQRIEIDAPE